MKLVAFVASLLVSASVWAHGGHDHGKMVHLTFAKGALHAHAIWTAGPQVSTESALKIEWKRGSDHAAVEPNGAFDVVLWMPSMGHGSSPTQITQSVNANGQAVLGSYDVTSMYFIMGGPWDVNITVKFADGSVETQTIKVNLPSGGGHHHHH